jgi:hypothetical protein
VRRHVLTSGDAERHAGGTGLGASAKAAAQHAGQGELDYAGLGIVAISFALVVAAVVYADGPPSPPSMLTSVPITANVTVRSTSITGTSTHI